MGGMAFKDKTRRILRQEISPTLKWLAKHTGLSHLYLSNHMLGSAGKNPTSGDIDLNMDENLFDKQVILDSLTKLLGPDDVKGRLHVNQIFTCVPIGGDHANGYVQVDFMFGDPVWQEFSYWSAGDQSQYKGLFRTELLKAAIAFNSDWTLMENGQLVARVGPTFFHDRGVVWRYRHKPHRKDGNGRVKAFAEITEAEFMKLYPNATKASKSLVDDPKQVSELVLGTDEAVELFETYEILVEALELYYEPSEFGTIMEIFEERLNSLKVDIPKDIQDGILTATRASHGGSRNSTT